MSKIQIKKSGITDIEADAIVNAANSGLWAGTGVCGAIFDAAGHNELQRACQEIGHCDVGSAVITPGFKSKAKFIIHAVGPIWNGGNNKEAELLFGAYYRSLELAEENKCESIVFPLISAGVFGYPVDKAWKVAFDACENFIEDHPTYEIEIIFAVLDIGIMKIGCDILGK